MKSRRQVADELDNFVMPGWGNRRFVVNKITITPDETQALKKRNPKEGRTMMNKAIFEEKWKLIRSQSTGWWSLMAEYDLNKVDKADVKFDKYVTMLQVKYGYTRQQARAELDRHWTEYEAKSENHP
jgi:hypothetical protein